MRGDVRFLEPGVLAVEGPTREPGDVGEEPMAWTRCGWC